MKIFFFFKAANLPPYGIIHGGKSTGTKCTFLHTSLGMLPSWLWSQDNQIVANPRLFGFIKSWLKLALVTL